MSQNAARRSRQRYVFIRSSDLKAIFFDLFETLITEKTKTDFQARAPFHERQRYSAVAVLNQDVDKGHGQSFAYHRVYTVVLSRFARWHSVT